MSDRFPARRGVGGDSALPVAIALLVLGVVAVLLAAAQAPGPSMVLFAAVAAVLVAAGAALGVWGYAYRRLTYALTESALRIEWLGRTVVVPYSAIQGIYGGQRLSGASTPSVPCWPGINVGPRRVRGMGRLRFFATSSDQSQLTLITVPQGGVVISARDPTEFQAALIEHVERSEDLVEGPVTWHVSQPSTAPWSALADVWLPACLGFGVISLLAVLATICLPYDSLPSEVPLHFAVSGEPSQIAPKSDLLRLPLLGLITLVLNWALGIAVHPRERTLGRLLWLVGGVVQLVLLVGVLRLVA